MSPLDKTPTAEDPATVQRNDYYGETVAQRLENPDEDSSDEEE